MNQMHLPAGGADRRRLISIAAIAAVVCVVCSGGAHAQYDDPRLEPPAPARYAGLTIGQRQFSPQGAGIIDFRSLVIGLVLHQEPLDVQFGYASYSLDNGDRTSLSLATVIGFDFPLKGPGRSGVFLPVMVTGDYTKAEVSGLQRDNFNVGSIGLGTGVKVRLAGEQWELEMRTGIAAQYSFEGFGVGTGFSPLLLGDATALIRSFPVLDGLAAGYRFRWQRWDMRTSAFDQRCLEHTVFLGVLF